MAETAEQCISSIRKRAKDQDDFDNLHRHYRSEGNIRRRVATEDRPQEKFHYKSERAFSFNTFLDRILNVFNIFRDEGEPMAKNTQVHELFRRVQHPQLQDMVKAVEV